ncbi:MAG: hypothetical protein HN704_01925 [Bacteroidetes bacterium]|jgi:uncharacterized protein (TIGR02646 family)|nr:hypothetical protein [Bacteroidota bacterium]MBT6688091.1 hypothetical protein [Bacteroidota bacterium]MBT7144524.1 hypothetical protein [Bacteroidota bacterium]MBT7490343.1 hypothetical protein [Bacteroidota bacterium]
MISIDKSNNIPQILLQDGIEDNKRICQEFDSNPLAYTSRPNFSNKKLKKLAIKNKIYGKTTVKLQLIADQKEKCCFCEAKFTATSYGDVEHFRPKKAFKKGRKLIYPGYYWLAYDWHNLLFSCEKCNRTYKKNEFPLFDENIRVKNHNEAVNLPYEEYKLINPICENPEEYIRFNQHIPVAINNSSKAIKSISIYGLDRPELNNERLEHLNYLKTCEFFQHFDLNNQEKMNSAMMTFNKSYDETYKMISTAKGLFQNAAQNQSKFAGMVRSNFPELSVE